MMAELYPQSGGQHVDGVFHLDVTAIAALLQFTGPLTIEGIVEPLTAENAAGFLHTEQYEIAEATERIDLLERLAETAVRRLLTSTLPPPAELARRSCSSRSGCRAGSRSWKGRTDSP
jgi:hypothetical protein